MPNHVTTTFRVSGPSADVAKFVAAHIVHHPAKTVPGYTPGTTRTEEAHTQFDFQTIIPMPAVLDGIVSGTVTSEAVLVITGKTLEELRLEQDPDNPHHAHDLEFKRKLGGMVPLSPEVAAARQQRMDNLTVVQLQMGLRAIEAINETGYPTWYEWCVANWGTKWNSYSFTLVAEELSSVGPGEYTFRFETAWSTPTPIFEKLCELYPTLEFTSDSYDEGGNFAACGVKLRGCWHEDATIPVDDAAYFRAYGEMPERDDDAEAAATPA